MALILSKPLGTLIRVADSDGGNGAANYEIADINNLVPGGVVLVRKKHLFQIDVRIDHELPQQHVG